MPTVPGMRAQMGMEEDQRPTPERLLMTAADMHARGQLTQDPTNFSNPGADLKLPMPGGGRGARSAKPHSKRR